MMPEPKAANARTAVVVDDDRIQLNVFTTLLERDGLTVKGYVSAEQALKEMSPEHPPALIVTDLYMPGIDGWRFCHLLRSPEYRAFNQTPIVVVSATFAGAEARAITADLGANAFVTIPFEFEQWHQVLRAVLAGQCHRVPHRVLIVDDDPTFAEMLRVVFSSYGYQPEVATTGEGARQAFRERPAQVVLLDYHLPDVNGDLLLQEFKQINPLSVVLMVTGDTTPELATRFMRQGASAYTQKPVDPSYLITLCERALRERALLRVEDYLEARTRELRVSEAQYRGLFSGMVSGFALHEIIRDAHERAYDYRFLEVNPAFEALLGLPRDQVVGKTARAVLPTLEADWLDTFAAVAATGQPAHFERYSRALDKYLEVAAFSPERGQFAITFVDITARKRAEAERERLITELQDALGKVKLLSGLLPICSSCKKIRDDKGYWTQLEAYIQQHSDAHFTHGICPDCAKRLFPNVPLPPAEQGGPPPRA
jgi:PAS domain S-box-containing protein